MVERSHSVEKALDDAAGNDPEDGGRGSMPLLAPFFPGYSPSGRRQSD
jgi:hypothetical protein